MLIINAMRFCKLYTAISNFLCLIVLTSGFTFNHLLGPRLTHIKLVKFVLLGYIALMCLVEAQGFYFKIKLTYSSLVCFIVCKEMWWYLLMD